MENAMTIQNPALGNNPALSKRRRNILTDLQWAELHDFLSLALDALGDGPDDFNADFLQNAVIHQRLALRITHKAMEKTGAMQ